MTTTVLRKPTDSMLKPGKPVITIVGKGPKAYLWVGDEFNAACFGTLHGTKAVSKLTNLLRNITRKRR